MKPAPFALHRPPDLAEALELLATLGPDAKVLAGGQSLLPTMNMRLAAPSALVDLSRIAALKGVEVKSDHVRIGAATTYAAFLADPASIHVPLLRLALPHVANAAVRNRGTLGGSLCHADPSAETAGSLLALDARLELAWRDGVRQVPVADFLRGVFQTALRPGELLRAILVPRPVPAWSWFDEHVRRRGDFAIAGLAAVGTPAGGAVAGLRLVFIGLGDRAVLAEDTMARLAQAPFDAPSIARAVAGLPVELAARAGAGADAYRIALTQDLLARALAAAGASVREDHP
ncbi:FAD binding domain-containing protein [Xanthobacter dioxanivorans]|uniref:FAD binding domain-containing protein n=1 Tax=Xanthobacter dioxanivorans TaxID=2528964 RepID=A0A974PPZ8_9HYPH|nr:FAD binding domain-containing protein [Xanthobacter dioxanivorans]QRG07025.1 FAD binding domain-containing protein [Xanthobacter dioxanivorans]